MDYYVFLINEGSKWMSDDLREVLTYKYAEAIYNDVIRMGSVIRLNNDIQRIEDPNLPRYSVIDIKT